MAGSIKLRDYQQQGIEQLYSKLKQGKKKVIFVLQTGGGKSLTMVEISRQCLELGCRVAIVMRRRTLVGQMSGTLDKSGIDHGIYMANHRRHSPKKQMQVCSIDTLGARSVYPDADVVICDESHDVRRTSSKYRELFEHYDDKTIIGFTATPFSDNSLWDDYICPISAQDLMERGFLVPAKIWVPNLIDVSNVAIKSTGEYDENDLFAACAESKVVGNIVEDWKKIGRGRRTILFAVNIEHSKLMADAFNKAGIPAMHCDANTKESDRNIALSSLKDGSIKVLCNVNIFSTGLDLVEIECIIFARPTRSVIYYLQAVGRGLRPAPHIAKKDCIIIDNAGNALRFGSPYKSRPVDMSRKKEIEKSVEDDVAIRTCKQCFFVFDAKENKCPECGFQNPKIEREIKTEDGELVEYQLSEEEVAIIRKKEFQADFHKLKWVARTRIYKHVKDSEGKELKWVCKKLAEKYGIDFCKENEKLLTGSQR